MKKTVVVLISVILIISCCGVNAFAFGTDSKESYTYGNDMEAMPAPASYNLDEILNKSESGTDFFSEVSDIQVYDGRLFVLDKGSGSILVFNSDYKLEKRLCEALSLNSPEGFYITQSGCIYIADTQNKRIVKTDIDGNLIAIVLAPDKKSTLSTVDFLPSRIVVDKGERLYIIVNDETNGIYQMDISGKFLGFFGSVPVVPSFTELLWRKLSTKEQLSRMLLFVPTEYSNIDIDEKGFIYTTVSTNTDSQMQSYIKSGGADSTLAPVRKLNPKNIDVLKRTGSMPPAGDYIVGEATKSDIGNSSRFVDVAVNSDGFYCTVDATRSRIFTYNQSGNLMYVFGNKNDRTDGFSEINAVCWWNGKIVVSDKGNNSIKLFVPTEYADMINQAVLSEKNGDYINSVVFWEKILKMHPQNNLAYIGVGKAQMRAGNYKTAMDWFKKADDSNDYSKALKEYRSAVGKKIVGIVATVIIVAVIAVILSRKLLRKKIKPKKNRTVLDGIKYGFYIMRHPFDGFWDMQFEKKGNLKSATAILGLTVIINLISSFATGYIVAGKPESNYNFLIQGILSVILPLALWCVANWSVTSLMNGSGTFKYIYMYSCYSLTPLLLGLPVLIVLSNIISADELALYNIIKILIFIWVGFLVFAGTLVIHQYKASGTVLTIAIIVIAIGIIIFIFLLCTSITQQITEFLSLLFEEINLRI